MAEIKKINTELQLLDKFLDASGDAGTSGQVLSSTGTGVNWFSGFSSVYTLAQTSGSASWMKLGTFTANQAGQSIFIKIVSNNGYNATISQNFEAYIRFKTSNGSSTDANGFAADSSFYTTGPSGSLGVGGVKWVGNAAGTAATSYELYVNVPAHSGNGSFYVAEFSVGSWVNSGTSATDPGVASSTVLIPQEQFRVGSTDFVVNGGGGVAYFGNSNVGIGVTNPIYKLDLAGNINISGTGGYLRWNSGDIAIKNEGSYKIGFQTYNATSATLSTKMVLDTNGNVGIGVTAPTVKLWVNQGNVTGTVIKASGIGAQIEIQSSTAGDAHLYMRPNTSSNKAAIFKMTAGTNYNWRWQDDAATPVVFMQLSQSNSSLSVKGDIIAYGAPSDERYKENIKPIESALDKAVKLQGVTFDWKESDSILDIKEDIGFIAQDVQKVVPELVRENEDGKLSLRYQGVTPILLEAIKELKAEIDLLKSKPCNCNNCNCSI
jgi:hypothetical protein